MVYVDWTKQGICKFWMLQSCRAGDRCRYRHPQDWRRLWNEETARQKYEYERYGIPHPTNPRGEQAAAAAATGETQRGRQPKRGLPIQPGTDEELLRLRRRRRSTSPSKFRRQLDAPQQSGLQEQEEEKSDVVETNDELAASLMPPPSPPPRGQPSAANLTPGEPEDLHPSTSPSTHFLPHIHHHHSSLDMGTKRMSNGEAKHPPRSETRVSAPYMSQKAVEKKLRPRTADNSETALERSQADAREDSVRLQGVSWIDNVRRALELPIRTYTTACVYYHRLRLAHPGLLQGTDPNVVATVADACAASLLTACKVEDTLKKSRDILVAAYNLKAPANEQLGSDDQIFDAPAKHVMVLERMVLEAGGFDFRSKQPHTLLVKIGKSLVVPEDGEEEKKSVCKLAFTLLTDLYRTFIPLKQTVATMALASLELAAHLVATTSSNNTSVMRDALQAYDLTTMYVTREEIMETLLDALDLYTHHTSSTVLGPSYSLDDFLRIRLAMNKECTEANIPRYTTAPPSSGAEGYSHGGGGGGGTTSRVANGHPTPVSPPQPTTLSQTTAAPSSQAHKHPHADDPVHTYRFMLNPQRAADERAEVQRYFVEEWEEYEEEVEVPVPAPASTSSSVREQRGGHQQQPPRATDLDHHHRPSGMPRSIEERERERERLRDREREIERERARLRDRERERDRRRYEDREASGRRYEESSHRDRRYDEDRRRRDDRR